MDASIPSYLFPVIICCARIIDVSLGTLRTVSVVRGRVAAAAVLGFFEISLWLLAASKVLSELDNIRKALGYALGYALGNVVGITIERKLAMGQLALRLVSRRRGTDVALALREHGFSVTEFSGRGMSGPVTLLYAIVERADLSAARQLAQQADPEIFIAVDDIHAINRALYPTHVPATGWRAIVKKEMNGLASLLAAPLGGHVQGGCWWAFGARLRRACILSTGTDDDHKGVPRKTWRIGSDRGAAVPCSPWPFMTAIGSAPRWRPS
jgi:uncharacterized protein YebE (UPF0316 family)